MPDESPIHRFVHHLNKPSKWIERPESDLLRGWWETETPICAVVGMGGVGKTSLVAHFLETLLRSTKNVLIPKPEQVFVFSFYHSSDVERFFSEVSAWTNIDGKVGLDSPVELLSHVDRRGSCLFVLDGLETAQGNELGQGNLQLVDSRLEQFFGLIASANWRNVRALVTTRVLLPDWISGYGPLLHAVRIIAVGAADDEFALRLLTQQGVSGDVSTLKRVIAECGNHPLTLHLVANYLNHFCGGDPEKFSGWINKTGSKREELSQHHVHDSNALGGVAGELNRLASAEIKKGEITSAILHLHRSLALTRSADRADASLQIALLMNLAEAYERSGKTEISHQWLLQALESVSFEKPVHAGTFNLLVAKISSWLLQEGRVDQALHFVRHGISCSEKNNDHYGLATHLNMLAGILRIAGNLELASTTFLRAIAEANKSEDLSLVATIARNIAATFREQGRLQEAVEWLDKARSLTHSIGDVRGEAVTLLNLSICEATTGRADAAIRTLLQAQILARLAGDPTLSKAITKFHREIDPELKGLKALDPENYCETY